MAIYKRADVYWYEFCFEGRRIRESSGYKNQGKAKDAEAARRAALLDRRAGLTKKKSPPKFEEQVATFLAWSKKQHKPKTHELHKTNCDTLLRYFRGQWLDGITTGMVEDFKLARVGETRKNAKDGSTVAGATVNRALTTLKLLYNHAERCGYDVSNPARGIEFFDEGTGRMRVVNFDEEVSYLAAASQPLKDIAQVILDTGLRPEEVFRIRVENIDFTARAIFNPFGKTKAARRKVTMTAEVCELLKNRAKEARGPYMFPAKDNPISRSEAFAKPTMRRSKGPESKITSACTTYVTRSRPGPSLLAPIFQLSRQF